MLIPKVRYVKPLQVQLWIHNLVELDSDDTVFQGPHDEIHMSGFCWDSTTLHSDETGKIVANLYDMSFPQIDLVGDIGTGKNYEDGRPSFPFMPMALSLEEIQVFPRTIAAHVNVVEEDNTGKILEEMKKLDKNYREEVIKLVAQKGSEGVGALFSVASSGAGSIAADVTKEVVNAIARATINGLFDAIIRGLENEALAPMDLTLDIPDRNFDFGDGKSNDEFVSSGMRMFDYFGGGGESHHHIFYEWRIQRDISYRRIDISRPGDVLINLGGAQRQIQEPVR